MSQGTPYKIDATYKIDENSKTTCWLCVYGVSVQVRTGSWLIEWWEQEVSPHENDTMVTVLSSATEVPW